MNGLVPIVLRELFDTLQKVKIEVVLLLILSLLHHKQASGERAGSGLADTDVRILQWKQDHTPECLNVLVEVGRRVVRHFLENEESQDAFVFVF